MPGDMDIWVWVAGCSGARNVWMRSANRTNANNVTYVNVSGNCNNNNARNGNRVAPDSAGHRGRRHSYNE